MAMMSPKERALFRQRERQWFQPSLFDGFTTDAPYSEKGTASVPVLDDRQKEALQCVTIPVFG